MPLVDSRGYQLSPNILGSIESGMNLTNKFQTQQLQQQRLQQQITQQQQAAQQAQQQQALLGNIFGSGAGTPPIAQQPGGGLQQLPVDLTQPQAAPQQLPAQTRDQDIAKLFAVNPKLGDQVMKSIGAIDKRKRTEAADFSFDLKRTPYEQRAAKIQARAQSLQSQGRDPSNTLELLNMPEQAQNEAATTVELAALSVEKRVERTDKIAKEKREAAEGEGVSEVQSSKILPGGLVQITRKDGSIEVKQASAVEREMVRRAEDRGVKLQQARAQGRGLGKATAKFADETFEKTDKLRENNNKMREVIANVTPDNTGPLMSRLPSFRAESVRLDNLRNQLGLDVIGSVTFGALSEAELNMALRTALPTQLEGAELIQWANDKIAAQEKLAGYLEGQAIYLTKPGNTRASWIEDQRTQGQEAAKQGNGGSQGQAAPASALTDEQLAAEARKLGIQ